MLRTQTLRGHFGLLGLGKRCHNRRSIMGQAARKEGDISAVFRSLSGGEDVPLPPRFADVKRSLLERSAGRDALQESWNRLLERLSHETEHIKANRATIIPEINFADIGAPSEAFNEAFRKRGVAVVRQVVPEKEARDYKTELEEYIAANPSTKCEYLPSPLTLSCTY
jgi:phenylalanyl-tRNA synthetase beta subunit